jgi:hypothetical protein
VAQTLPDVVAAVAPYSGRLVVAGTTETTTVTLRLPGGIQAQYLAIVVDTTTASGGNTVTPAFSALTAQGFEYPLVGTPTAIASDTTTVYRVGPALTASADLTANDLVPSAIICTFTVAGTVAFGVDYVLGA